jgi:hypothetical protein
MAVSSSPHLPTSPNDHPVAARHLGDGAEAAGAANEVVQPPDTALELEVIVSRMRPSPSAVYPSTQTNPVVLPNTPTPHPVATRHLDDGVEVTAAAQQAYLPPDTPVDVATTLPPPPPSPSAIQPSIQTCPTHLPTPPNRHPVTAGHLGGWTVFMGPSQHVEEVLLGLQLHENKIREIHNNNQYECPSISNCNAEEGDERGATERDPELPSESKATEINTPKVSHCIRKIP